jgi:type IV pilus assembly protein PilW
MLHHNHGDIAMRIRKQLGLSLVEILVALVISLFLLGGMIQVLVANKATYRFSEGVSRVQENGRFAIEKMTQDIRMAGFRGCATTKYVNNLNPEGKDYNQSMHDFFGQPDIQGTENDGLNGSDTLVIRGVAPGQANVLEPYNSPTSAQIFINVNDFVETGDIVLISNCRGADIFQVTRATPGDTANKVSVVHNSGDKTAPGNYNPDSCQSGHCLSQTYGGDSALFKMQTVTYTIETGGSDSGKSGEPALFRSVFGKKSELVNGVEQLQILYGVDSDSDGTPNQYVISSSVTDWDKVTAIRIMLLLRSPESAFIEGSQSYFFNGKTLSSTDNRLRQVFTTTIALRNKL